MYFRHHLFLWGLNLLLLTWGLAYSVLSYKDLGSAVRYKLQIMPVLLGMIGFLLRRPALNLASMSPPQINSKLAPGKGLPMKVLLVLEATLGGAGRHVLDLAGGLLEKGDRRFRLIYSTLRADGQFLAKLALLRAIQPSFHCHSIPITREVAFSDISSYLELSRYVRDHDPFDVIHAHLFDQVAGFFDPITAESGPRQRIVYTPHGLMTLNPELTGIRRRAVCVLEAMLAHRNDVAIAVSDAEHRCAVETGDRPVRS